MDYLFMRLADYILSFPFILLALAAIAVLGANLVGDWLRNVPDPRLRL